MSGRKPLVGFLVAQAVSLTGTRISMIALPWLVLTTTGSATRTGLISLAEMLPMVLFKVVGGPLTDRLGPRRVSICCDAGSVLAVGAIPVLHAAGGLTFAFVLILVGVAGALRGPGDSAKNSILPSLAEQASAPMERVTGLSATVERTASLVGTAFAGGLVAATGAANALVVDAASFALSAVVLGWAVQPAAKQHKNVQTADALPTVRRNYASQLREGWSFLRHDRVLIGIALMVAFTNLLDTGYATLLVPVWAKESGGGAGTIGMLFAVISGASVGGALMAAAWGPRLPRFKTYLLAFLIGGAPRFVALSHGLPLGVVLTVAAVSGVMGGFINPVIGAVVFERIPAGLVGRVTALTSAACFALMPFGGLVAGALVTRWGLDAAVAACGAAYFIFTMVPALDRRWREMDRRPGGAASMAGNGSAVVR